MKICLASSKSRQGGVLILTVLLFGFAALFLATYLLLTQSESYSVARSQAWNNAMALAEAGVEDALALINKNVAATGGITNWYNNAVSADGWTQVTNNVFSMTRWLGTNQSSTNLGYYTVFVTNSLGSTGPSILSIGYSTWNSSGGTFKNTNAVRKVFVQTKRDSLISGNLAAITTVDFSGNNILADSFDSSDPYHSNWQTNWTYRGNYYGYYPSNAFSLSPGAPDYATEPYMHKDNAYVTTDGSIINVGNGDVYGYVDTAPGGTASVGANGSVGDVRWVPLQGIQPGHAFTDMNVNYPNAVLPTNNWTSVSRKTGSSAYYYGNTNQGFYTFAYVITNSGYYKIDQQVKDSLYINGTNVVVYMPNGLNFNGNAQNTTLWLETNSDVTIYSGGNVDTTGNTGINNISQYALAFAIYGLPTCTSIKLGGQVTITAYIYAPAAALTLNGGGGNVYYHSVGAFFVYSIKLTGNMGFHYDEAFKLNGPARGFIPVFWQEVQ